jgi:hypothetical protein
MDVEVFATIGGRSRSVCVEKGVFRLARLRRAAKAISKTVLIQESVRMTENNTSRKTTSANEKG